MYVTKNKVRDLMVPIDRYAVTTVNSKLQEAVAKLEEGFFEEDPGRRHRTILVLDESGNLVGTIDFRRIIEVMIPECSELVRKRLEELGLAVMEIRAPAENPNDAGAQFRDRALKNAQTKVRDIMLATRGSIQADADLLEGIKIKCSNKLTVLPVYVGKKLVGVLRDVDVFLAIAEILRK
ncbi:CBS domain-containing protein [Thermodesulfobacteriota bacterium]